MRESILGMVLVGCNVGVLDGLGDFYRVLYSRDTNTWVF